MARYIPPVIRGPGGKFIPNPKYKTPPISMKIGKFVEDNNIGKLIHFKYNPKHKDKLWRYDTQPLVIMLKSLPDGFAGINLHFAPTLAAAASILGEASEQLNNDKMDYSTRMMITYEILKMSQTYGMSHQCYRRYLFSHLRSSVEVINPTQWKQAIRKIRGNIIEKR